MFPFDPSLTFAAQAEGIVMVLCLCVCVCLLSNILRSASIPNEVLPTFRQDNKKTKQIDFCRQVAFCIYAYLYD